MKLKDAANELVEEYLQVQYSVATLSDRCANLCLTQFFGYTKARHCFQAERRAKRLTLSAPEADDDGGQWQTFSTTQVRATCYAPCDRALVPTWLCCGYRKLCSAHLTREHAHNSWRRGLLGSQTLSSGCVCSECTCGKRRPGLTMAVYFAGP